MSFLYFLSYLSILIQIIFITLCLAAGLYYLSELVESYTVITKKIITVAAQATIVLYIVFIFTDDFSWTIIILGIFSQIIHLIILRNFPDVKLLSLEFVSGVLLLLVNHWLAYQHFERNFHNLSEILAYFCLFLWLVPFALFVSLSANDQVLPTSFQGQQPNEDVVTNYFSTKKRKGLLSFFNSLKESSILPQRNKKAF
ncbi:unnamed protein product [Diamesa serratosioi]